MISARQHNASLISDCNVQATAASFNIHPSPSPSSRARRRQCRARTVAAAGGEAPERPLVVVGSINADIVLQVARMPSAGETLEASSLSTFPGGKGANQAAAAARLGCSTYFVGQVGEDANAGMLRGALQDSNVDTSFLREVPGPCGTAVIMVDSSGENCITIVGGANTAEWDFTDGAQQLLRRAGSLLLQREIPEAANLQAAEVRRCAHQSLHIHCAPPPIELAAEAGATVVLDCGGAEGNIADELLQRLSIISPNETELSRLTGLPTSTGDEAVAAAKALLGRGVSHVLVKMGAKGSFLLTEDGRTLHQPIISAGKVVDTTGAGDCYTAAFAAALQEGRGAEAALKFAAGAAGLCVSQSGALPSLPQRKAVEELML